MYQSKRLSKIRDKEISELRDTPPEFITSLFNSKSSSGSDLYCLSLNIRISEFWLSEALDQNVRAELQIRVSELFLSELCFGSEYQSFSLQNIMEHSCTCRLKKKQKTYSSISELECSRISVLVIRYYLKYHSCSPPFWWWQKLDIFNWK